MKDDVAGLKTSVARLEVDVAGDVTGAREQPGALADVAQVHDALDRLWHRRAVALEARVNRPETGK